MICELNSQGTDVGCYLPFGSPAPADSRRPQTIAFQQAPAPGSLTATYPLAPNSDLFVSATSNSGLPVDVAVQSGAAAPVVPPSPLPVGTLQFHVGAEGSVVLKATQGGNAQYQPARAAILSFDIGAPDKFSCKGLFPVPNAPSTVKLIDAAGVVTLLGTPVPFQLAAQGPSTIFVYTTRFGPTPAEQDILSGLENQIRAMLGRTPGSLGISSADSFTVELTVPHARSLGDLASKIAALNSKFTVQDVGSDKVRIGASSQPGCNDWTSFLTDLRRMINQFSPEPYTMRLFNLGQMGGSDVNGAFTNLNGSGGPSAAPSASPSSNSPSPSSAAPATAPPGNASISVNQPPGSLIEVKSNTTPCVIAGLTMSNSSACAPSSSSGGGSGGSSGGTSSGGSGAPAGKPSIGMASVPYNAMTTANPPTTIQTSDTLVFSNTNPGDDAAITERKRIVADLDLPRPEMIINAWVMQNSTTSASAAGAFSDAVKSLVSKHNEKYEAVTLKGWEFIRNRIAAGGYFDPAFYHYVVDRYLGDAPAAPATEGPSSAAQSFLENAGSKVTFPNSAPSTDFGICAPGKYCLGYVDLFQPLKPRLTDLLLALIAAQNPAIETIRTIDFVEGRQLQNLSLPLDRDFCDDRRALQRDRCREIWRELDLGQAPSEARCDWDDLQLAVGSAFLPPPSRDYLPGRVYLSCMREAAQTLLEPSDPAQRPGNSPSGAGLIRAAVANFLFNYKMSQQYPHEFDFYDLSQSADALNVAMTPLIEAFNRDITAFQRFVRADVLYQVDRINRERDERCCVKRLFGLDEPSFFNDGIVTVRTVSGQLTSVNTASQSFLNVSQAPQLSALLSALNPPAAAAAPLGGASLAASALSAFQTTYAQIGRQLNVIAIPRSLATASSAEITVSLNADDSSSPPLYSGGPQSGQNANISRVATHDTQTRVRVDSVKLLEVSSFAAVLRRSRSKFPLIPPFVELPYIGTIAGVPLPQSKEYHQSTAILSAVVVPTAADIAYGLRFASDRVAEGGKECSFFQCSSNRILSLWDFKQPVRDFNKEMVHCFATDMRSPYASINGFTAAGAALCANLNFANVPH